MNEQHRALIKRTIKKAPVIFLGCFLSALSVSLFVEPAGLLASGCTGIGMLLHHFTGLPTAAGIWIASISFFVWGFFALGIEFSLNTLIGAICFPLSYNITSWIISHTGVLTEDIFLCMVFAGICTGSGIGIILRVGASGGATDVPAVILNKKFNIPVSFSLNMIDGLILCLQMPFSEPQRILYALLYVLLYSVFSGKIITYGQEKIQVQIVSPHFAEINRVLLEDMDHGSTLIHIQGGYSQNETFAVVTIVSKRELFRIRDAALSVDPQAFIVINPVLEVDGRGFSLKKQYGLHRNNSCQISSGKEEKYGL